jgi:hypothetical protein
MLGCHISVVYAKITAIGHEGVSSAGQGERPPVGSWIKSWVPLDVLLEALLDWHERGDALAATFLLPTKQTKDYHPSPGRLSINSTIRGHLAAILRHMELLAAQTGATGFSTHRAVQPLVGYRSVPGPIAPATLFEELRNAEAIRMERFDPSKDVYKALRPALEMLTAGATFE